MVRILVPSANIIINKVRISPLSLFPAFTESSNFNVLPLIYDEKKKRCDTLVFDYDRAMDHTSRIVREEKGKGRRHVVHRFYDRNDNYICEVRYGDTAANALQRGLWTHTKNALEYFDSLTNGWVDYSHNLLLVQLFSHALISSSNGHQYALAQTKDDVLELKKKVGLLR